MIWKKYKDNILLNGNLHNIQDFLQRKNTGIQKWQQDFFSFLKEWTSTRETIIVKTSGSTGNPKYIEIYKDTLVKSALNTGNFLNLKAGDKALLCLPVTYIAGKMMIVRALVLGLDLHLQKPGSIPEIEKEYDFCAMTPMQLENILNRNKSSLDKIKTLIVGGAPVNYRIIEEIENLETQIFETYGMTETVSHIALKKINGNNKSQYFTTLENIEVGIDDRSCLKLIKSNLGIDSIQTNDIVELKDSHHFKWLGRADNIINSGGIKLIPEQIEDKLKPVIKNDFFIFGFNDAKYGQVPAIVIEGKRKDIILDFSTLNKFEIPKKIFFLKNFKRTESGKIKRNKTINLLNLPGI